MKLNIPERIALLGVLPQQGSVVTLRIMRELQSQLSFTEEEIERFNIKNQQLPDGQITISWNPEMVNEEKDIKIGKAGKGIIEKQLKQLDSRNQLHITMLPIYEKFVEGKEE